MVGLAVAVSAGAYVLSTDESGVYVNKWHRSPLAFQVKLPTAANLSDGTSQSSSVILAMETWNQVLGTVRFAPQAVGAGSYLAGNGINEVVKDDRVRTRHGDEQFSTNTLALTMIYTLGNQVTETDIVFNTDYTWDSFRGTRRIQGVEDIRRVALHELGHALGLEHVPEGSASIMTPRVSNTIDTLQADDIAGGQRLYGAPGVVPANDAFANAATLTLSGGSAQVVGSTIAATRQAGEPNHENVVQGRSIWWRWTAAGSGAATATTLGSDFDTVLAVYTGVAVNALTPVTSNDDEEMPNPNDWPERKRTSRVTFNAVRGTTYYFAVDGWARDGDPAYTGTVVLTLTHQGTDATAPTITSHPTSQTVAVGGTAVFTVNATGSGAFAYQWRRNGVNLTPGGRFVGVDGPTLTIMGVEALDAGSYAVEITNEAGRATSNAAMLTVTGVGSSSTRMVALATRARAGTGDQTLVMGLVVDGPKDVLLRGVGPGIASQGVDTAIADPELELNRFVEGVPVRQGINDDWESTSEMLAALARVGAALEVGSKDSAMLMEVAGGVYTAHVTSRGAEGVALADAFDAGGSGRFTALATRAYAGTGNDILIAGLVLEGSEPKTVLIRALGPTLASRGVNGVLANPRLEVFRHAGGTHHLQGENDDWGGAEELKRVFAEVGAADPNMTDESKDAALLVTLNPGVYTVHVSGVGDTTGVALVEVFDVP
jgi:Matrixin./Immunoglobulin I-set domain.